MNNWNLKRARARKKDNLKRDKAIGVSVYRILAMLYLVLIIPSISISEPINRDIAEIVASTHLKLQGNLGRSMSSLAPPRRLFDISEIRVLRNSLGVELAYIADLIPNGFIAISPDTDIQPIIAYSFDNQLPTEDKSFPLHILKQDMSNRLDSLSMTSEYAKMENNILWEKYLDNSITLFVEDVEQWPSNKNTGLLDTTWNQDGLYNDSCPDDPNTIPGKRFADGESGGTEDGKCLTGCTATAMGQIINYWRFPANIAFTAADDYISSMDPGDGFGERIIHISAPEASILDIGYGNGDPSPSTIADLLFACGVACKANYSDYGTSAALSAAAYYRFGYASAVEVPGNDDSLYYILKDNMKNAQPAQISIAQCNGNLCEGYHTPVVDGYRVSSLGEYYHLNFGWGSSLPDSIAECWYSLPELMPDGYNLVDMGILNISPDSGPVANWYVSSDGDDSNDGTSWATAKKRIQAAILSAQPGDTISVAAGTYQESIGLRNDITLLGAGSEKTIIEFGGENVVIYADQIQSGIISGFTVAYAGTAQYPTIWLGDSSVTITQCIVTGATHSGIYIAGNSNPEIKDNEIRQNTGPGIFMYSGSQAAISDNTISTNEYSGIEVSSNCKAEISNNEIKDNNGSGIFIHSEGLGTISGNTVTGNKLQGITVRDKSNSAISENKISDNMGSGIVVDAENFSTISDNIISGNEFQGIAIANKSNPTVKNNEIKNNKGVGIYVYSEALGIISENTISENELSGIMVIEKSSPEIRNNEIRDNQQVGIFVKSESRGVISGNVISGSEYRGIEVKELSAPAIIYNTITDNSGSGIWAYYGATPDISNNIIAKNITYGINIGGPVANSDGNPTISYNNVWSNSFGNYVGVMIIPETNISVDPLFVDFENGDYHLLENSLCRGASQNGSDLGAYSSQDAPNRTLVMASIEAAPGENITIPLSITDTTGLAGADINIGYDPDLIAIDDVKSTELTQNMVLMTNDSSGEIKIAMAGTEELPSGDGILLNIEISVSSDAPIDTETILSLENGVIYNELGTDIAVNVENGVVRIKQNRIKGDVNSDGFILSNDAILTLRITAQLVIPDIYQTWAADFNNDGKVKASDATLILREVAGLPAPCATPISGISEQITVRLPDAYGTVGEGIAVPVKIDKSNMLSSGEICIAYDSKVLRATGIISDSGALFAYNIARPGIARIAFAGINNLNREMLAELEFDILANSISPLTVTSAHLYNSDALPLVSRSENAEFRSWEMPAEKNALLQNYPNPFNPETWIPYQLRQDSYVAIKIYNLLGNLIRELPLGHKSAGLYTNRDRAAYWDGRNAAGESVASGIYFILLEAGKYRQTKCMTLIR